MSALRLTTQRHILEDLETLGIEVISRGGRAKGGTVIARMD